MSDYQLAQINIGRLLAPVDHPRIAGFVAGLEPINALADRSPGFVWRLQSGSGNATDVPYNEDPLTLVNTSVWESIEALKEYVYRSEHLQFFRRRHEWFEKMAGPHSCLWWVPAGHRPTVAEGKSRLEHYRLHGATSKAFWFSDSFPAPIPGAAKAALG